jgi:phosphoglycolate phosphatase
MRLVIFDLDGTLVDSVALIVETVTAAFEAVGEPIPTEAAIRSISGISAPEAMGILAPSADQRRVDELLASYRREYERRGGGANRQPLFRNALETLERLRHRPDTILAVATGKGHASTTTLLDAHGILDWFHSIETPTHNRGKPDPQMIDVAIQKAGVEVSRAVMVGDTVHDMHMARAAGVAAIGVAWGYHLPVDLAASGADIVIDRFDQLEPAIDRLLGQDA